MTDLKQKPGGNDDEEDEALIFEGFKAPEGGGQLQKDIDEVLAEEKERVEKKVEKEPVIKSRSCCFGDW